MKLSVQLKSLDIRHTKNCHIGKKTENYAEIHLPFSDLRYDEYPSNCWGKNVKNADFSYLFHDTSRDIHLIRNRRTGGDSTHNFALSSYTSLLVTTNIQSPNCGESAMRTNTTHIAPSWCHRDCGNGFRATVPETLASVINASIRGSYRLEPRLIGTYSAGVRYGTEEFKQKMCYMNRTGK